MTEYICTSRLARAAGLYADEPANLRKLHRVLAASSNVKAAAIWFAEDPSRGSCPSALQGQEIGELKVTYSPSLISKQRRYADGPCIFGLPKLARYAATHGLYIDGDLVGKVRVRNKGGRMTAITPVFRA